MNKIDDKMVNEAKDFVLNIFDEKLSENLLYHGVKHTLDVLNNVEIIGKYGNLNEDDLNILRICAIFHDVGYIDIYDGHEAKSAIYAAEFFQSKHVDGIIIKQVVDAILSTQLPQKPKDVISEMLCDADLMYLADQSEYIREAELLRQEWAKMGKTKLNDHEFYVSSLEFFKSHHFHSEFGKNMLRPKKEKNAKLIGEKIFNISHKPTV